MDGVRSVRLRLVPSPVCVLQAVGRLSRHTHSHRATGDHSTGPVTSKRLYHWPASIFSYKTYTWHESWNVLKHMLTFSLYNRCCRSPWASVIRSSLNPPLTPGKKTELFIWSARWLRFFSRWFCIHLFSWLGQWLHFRALPTFSLAPPQKNWIKIIFIISDLVF